MKRTRANEVQKQEILNKLHDLETSEGIPNKGMQADIEFHCSIYESTNNMLLANLKHFVKALIKEKHRILGGESPRNVRVHRKIAEAIVNQKASDAFDATTELLRLKKITKQGSRIFNQNTSEDFIVTMVKY